MGRLATLGMSAVHSGQTARRTTVFGGSHSHVASESFMLSATEPAMDRQSAAAPIGLKLAPLSTIHGSFGPRVPRRTAFLTSHYCTREFLRAPLHTRKPACFSAKQVLPTLDVSVGNIATATASQTRNVTSASHARRLDQPSKTRGMFLRVARATQNFNVCGFASKFWVVGKRLDVVSVKLFRRSTSFAAAVFRYSLFYNFARFCSISSGLTNALIGHRCEARTSSAAPHNQTALPGAIGRDLCGTLKSYAALLARELSHRPGHASCNHVPGLCSSLNGGNCG